MLVFFKGHLRDLVRNLVVAKQHTQRGYAQIRQDYEDFYTRRAYFRIHDNWNRPICSAPDTWIDVSERTPMNGQRPLELTGRKLHCLNLSSYNYLGFASADQFCTPRVLEAIERYGWATCSSRTEAGTTTVHQELDDLVARFLGKEAAVTFGMGFATNSVVIPVLVGKGCLVISDSLNHASIVAGVRGSGAKVKVFEHNDVEHLEGVLRASIAEGQPRTRRPWKKILIIVEGIYSMEGKICRLREIVKLKQRYKEYLYLDEAHSIGVLGATGRGCAEWSGVDTRDIDVMMGTFTKSFGASGGYIASDLHLPQIEEIIS